MATRVGIRVAGPSLGVLLSLLLAASTVAQQPVPFFGNQRTLIVANGNSPLSLALAQRYAELRHIDPERIVVLDDVPGSASDPTPIAILDCTERILRPIANWLADHHLTDEIDCIAYSSGFPHAAEIESLPVGRREDIGSAASLTGLTCFLRQTSVRDFACIALDANPYATSTIGPVQGRGFAAAGTGRGRCYQSMMLSWLGPLGLGYEEAVQLLERAIAADASRPEGTVYLLDHDDVRAKTRQPLFATTVKELAERKRKATILSAGANGQDGVLPIGKADVLGAVVGFATFDWPKSGSTMLPGAIAEHLTSFGAAFQTAGQTKLTAWLRAGAAGTSGTVTEPFAIQAKFPTPLLHVYYADGCSLGEAFHQSVSGPFQLLILGDPGCRPFARLAPLRLPSLPETWSGPIELQPICENTVRFEAWLGGTLAATATLGEPLRIDTTAFADGPHEFQLVAIGPPPVEVPTAIQQAVIIDNHGLAAVLAATRPEVELDRRFTLTGKVPAGAQFELCAGRQVLDRGTSANGTVTLQLPAAKLGLGTTALRLVADLAGKRVQSAACRVTTTPVAFAGTASTTGAPLPGFAIDVADTLQTAQRRRSGILRGSDAIVVPAGGTATVNGAIRVATAGMHEVTCGRGELRGLSIDGKAVLRLNKGADADLGHGVVLDLAAGWHTFAIEIGGQRGAGPRLSLTGPDGAIVLDDRNCGQAPFGLVVQGGLAPKNAAWTDGNRKTAAAPDGDAAEVGLSERIKVGALLVSFHGLSREVEDLAAEVAVELRDTGGWSSVRRSDLRVLESAPGGERITCLLATPGGRLARTVRVRAMGKSTVLQHLSEIEVRAER